MRPKLFPTLALAAALLCPAVALAGPTWISVELPVRPWGQSAKLDPLLLIHAPHLADHEGTLSATAEGKVGSKRQSVPLTLHPTGEPDVWAVTHEWPRSGQWVLVFRATGHVPSTAVVDLRHANLGAIDLAEFVGRTADAWTFENIGVMSKVGAVSAEEIDALLAGTAGLASTGGGTGWGPMAVGLGAALLVLLGTCALPPLRRRRSGSELSRVAPNSA